MARISISIPDDLMARLEPMKDGINISQLCREALERRIAAFERAADVNGPELDLAGLVERLREECAVDEGRIAQLGKRNAAAWLGTTAYVELKNVAEPRNGSNMPKYKLPRAAFETMKRDMADANGSCDGVQAVAYKTAWLDYVRSVWAQIVGQLEPEGSKEPEEVLEEVSP